MYLYNYLLATLLVICLLGVTGCKKDQPESSSEGTLELKFAATTPDGAFELKEPFALADGRKMQLDMFKYYISNVELVAADGQTQRLTDVELIDFDGGTGKTAHGGGVTRSFKVKAGRYKGLRLRVGLDSTRNYTDATTYPASHPQSVTKGTYWTWATGYRFIILEGKVDAAKTGTADAPVSYHTGTNALTFTVDFANKGDYEFEVKKDAYTHFNLSVDLNKVFYGGPHHLDLNTEHMTHAMGPSYPLAEKITQNFQAAYSAHKE